jgi:hypothetical protein
MDHWHVTLEGFPADSGEVFTKDGEIIGTYTLDDNNHCQFTPNGADEPVVYGYHIGPVCSDIAHWHERQNPK